MARKAKPTQRDITAAAIEALLERHHGRVSPRVLLEEARDPDSPFHDHFNWNNDEAAEEHRLSQAAQLIRRWKGSVMRIDAETRTVKVESVRRVQSPVGQRSRHGESYETVEQLMSDPLKRDDMLRTVLRELRAYRRRYAELSALAEVWQAIDDAIELHGEESGRQPEEPTAHVEGNL